jgi:hypothetical protein
MQDEQQGIAMAFQNQHIRSVFIMGSQITNYHYNKILIVKKYINIKMKNRY